MSGVRRATDGSPTSHNGSANAVFVVGMHASGVDLLGDALSLLGLPALRDDESQPRYRRLSSFNDRLLTAATAPGEPLPAAAPAELVRELAGWLPEAKDIATKLLPEDSAPWVWADPRLSFLVPFWSAALELTPAVILVHRAPWAMATALTPGAADAVATWDRYNRSALVLCGRYPSLVVSYDDLVRQGKETLSRVGTFLSSLGMPVADDLGSAVAPLDTLDATSDTRDPVSDAVSAAAVLPAHKTLHRLLASLDGHTVQDDGPTAESLVDVTADFYTEDYYGTSYDEGGVPYRRDEEVWVSFFEGVANAIAKSLGPATVLDVGCAIGMLVEALRNCGIDAKGFDLSPWAIEQVPARLQPFCWVGSVTEEIEGHYDLITCIEVLEHLPPWMADAAVGNICRHADHVLFSSTPDDFDEPTHLNVEPGGYWANLFLRHGFVRDLTHDTDFLAPHAMLFRRGEADAESLVAEYERALWAAKKGALDAAKEQQGLRDAAIAEAHREKQEEILRAKNSLEELRRRRDAENRAAFEEVRYFENSERRLAGLLEFRETQLKEVYNTKTFRYSMKLRHMYGRLRGMGLISAAALSLPDHLPPGTYDTWIETFDSLDDDARTHIRSQVSTLTKRPKIAVLMPVYNPPVDMLRAAIESVRDQLYEDWELCIADDCSTDTAVQQLLSEYAASDDRVKVIRREENGHISAASNSALSLVSGEWVALLDHDDILAPHALALFALAIAEHPEVGVIYSDEDKLDQSGKRRDPFFKPDFDPLLLLGQNFVSHFSAFRKDLVDRVGGYRVGYEGSQDWDLTLRVTELLTPSQVVHIPHVLYHWRVHASSTASLVSAKPYAVDAGQRAVIDHLERTKRRATTTRIGQWGFNRVTWELPDPPPRVSVIIPTRDGDRLTRCIDSVLAFTIYPDFEVLVVDNGSRKRSTMEYLRGNEHRITVIRDDRPFNHSALNNLAVAQSSGEVVCLLNDDTEVIGSGWLTEMVGQLSQPGIGAVGAKLYYGDGRVQHAGVILGVHGVAAHAHRNFDRLSTGYFGHLQLAHRMSAVTAACTVVRREAWRQVGGFDEASLPNVLNDVDLCLRLGQAGWDIVWTPYAELFHHESTSRGVDNEGPQAEAFDRAVAVMETKWGIEGLRNDPHYSPNLSLDAEDFSLAWPPRVPLYRIK
jgi:glycosyltransferase involved in cell wall biosynthesis/2-polyprenyl-3-methyl-5-hydroxy-6-metoxy-1,4-benzoquinol methylase